MAIAIEDDNIDLSQANAGHRIRQLLPPFLDCFGIGCRQLLPILDA
jgi:hypothetical protein